MEAVESALKYIVLYTGCNEHTSRRIRLVLEQLYKQAEQVVYIKEKETIIEEVLIQKKRPKNTIKKWSEEWFVANDTSYEQVALKSRKTEVCKLRNRYCVDAYREGYGSSEIGRYLKRDHTTILHCIHKIKTK